MADDMFGTVSKRCQQSELSRAAQEKRRFEQMPRPTTADKCVAAPSSLSRTRTQATMTVTQGYVSQDRKDAVISRICPILRSGSQNEIRWVFFLSPGQGTGCR